MTVCKAERAVHPPSLYHAEGHLGTVHGLGLVSKQRNRVCTNCYGSSQCTYKLKELWPLSLYCSCRRCIHCRSVLRAKAGTWCDCMASLSALRTCAEPSLQLCGNLCFEPCPSKPNQNASSTPQTSSFGSAEYGPDVARAIGCGGHCPLFIFFYIRYPLEKTTSV